MGEPNQTPSRQFGRYRVCRELASGGMATVYLATRTTLSREFEKTVAIKVVHPHLAKDLSFVRMFLDEARIAMNVDHPNVCSMHEVGIEDGAHYLVMEYLQGRTLAQVLKTMRVAGRPQDTQHFMARIIIDASEGLHAAHTARNSDGLPLEIVHRDVSPQNIMITRGGAVKVVDFGVARARERLEHTASGLMKGKLEYASPEQIAGDTVDHRTDIWALGVCLWEALGYTQPFRRSNPTETISAICARTLERPTASSPWIEPELEKIILRAVHRDPAHRFQTARELALALRRHFAQQQVTVEAPELSGWLAEHFAAANEVAEGLSAAPIPEPLPSLTGPMAIAPQVPSTVRRLNRWTVPTITASALLIMGSIWAAMPVHAAEPAPALLQTAAPSTPAAPVAEPSAVIETGMPPYRGGVLLAAPTPPQAGARTAPVVAARRPPAMVTARLRVQAEGGTAEVSVDGVVRGHTPLSLELPPGKHRVGLRDLASDSVAEQEFDLREGVERLMDVRLDQ